MQICQPHFERGQRVPAVRVVDGTPMCSSCFRGFDVGDDLSRRLSRAALKTWRDPKIHARRTAAIRSRVADPKLRRLGSELRRREWQDPEIRSRRLEGLKRRWAQRKSEGQKNGVR